MFHRLTLTLTLCLALSAPALAADTIRLAVQTTGTLAWEIDVMRQHKLDVDFDLKVVEQGGPEAGDAGQRIVSLLVDDLK